MPESESPPPPRARAVIVVTSVLTLLVMAGVIALALSARQKSGARGDPFAGNGLWGDPYRNVPWDDAGCEPDAGRPARLVFELPPEGLLFGDVKQGVVLERTVAFRNEGRGTLCIRDVDSGCGCIKAGLEGDTRVYEPGERGAIRIVLDTEGREGGVTKVVAIYTNELDRPRLTFEVKASISSGLIATPLHANFPRALAGDSSTAVVRLRSASTDAAWEVLGVEGRAEPGGEPVDYTYDVRPMADPGQRIVDVHITHPGRDEEGPFQDALVIRTTHPDRPEVVVRAHLMVVPPIVAYPRQLAFGYVPAPDRKLRVRLLPGTDAVSFEIRGVRVERLGGEGAERDAPGFEARWERGPDTNWFVDVVYDGQRRAPGPLQARLVVETDLPDMPEVRIEIRARVRE